MNIAEAQEILKNALSPDLKLRNKAEYDINDQIYNNYEQFLIIFSEILINSKYDLSQRGLCSIVLKNTFHSKNEKLQKVYEDLWFKSSQKTRQIFKENLEDNLNIKNKALMHSVTAIYGSIARIEISNRRETDFFNRISFNIQSENYSVGSLNALSVATVQLYDETEYDFSKANQNIYDLALLYLKGRNGNKEIYEASLNCLFNCMEVFYSIFKNENNRNFFVNLVLEYIQTGVLNKNKEVDLKIAELCLQVLNVYFELCNNEDDNQIIKIINFYNDLQRLDNNFYYFELCEFYNVLIDLKKTNLIEKNFNSILPVLFKSISKEDPSDTEWTLTKASINLISEINKIFNNNLLKNNISQKFIYEKISSTEPNDRVIAYMILGSIYSNDYQQVVLNFLNIIINDFDNEITCNEALFCISKIFENSLNLMTAILQDLVGKLIAVVSQLSEFSENGVWAIYSIFVYLQKNENEEIKNIINFNYTSIITCLVESLGQLKFNQFNVRNAVNTTLIECIKFTSDRDLLEKLAEYLFYKINNNIALIKNSKSDEELCALEDVISGFIVLLTCCYQKFDFGLKYLYNIYLLCLDTPPTNVQGEVYISASTLIDSFHTDFLDVLVYKILEDIKNRDNFVLRAALNLLSDIANKLEDKFCKFIPDVIPGLIDSVSNQNTSLDLKVDIIDTFANIALSVGNRFNPYVEMSVILFEHINTLDRNKDEVYIDNLRKNILKLFSCITLSCGDSVEMRKFLPKIVLQLKIAIEQNKDHNYDYECVYLIKDLYSKYDFKEFHTNWIKDYLYTVISLNNEISPEAKILFNQINN